MITSNQGLENRLGRLFQRVRDYERKRRRSRQGPHKELLDANTINRMDRVLSAAMVDRPMSNSDWNDLEHIIVFAQLLQVQLGKGKVRGPERRLYLARLRRARELMYELISSVAPDLVRPRPAASVNV